MIFCFVGNPLPSAFVHVNLWHFGLARQCAGYSHRSRAVRAYRQLGLHTSNSLNPIIPQRSNARLSERFRCFSRRVNTGCRSTFPCSRRDVGFCAGFRTPAMIDGARAAGPASGSRQGTNPRAMVRGGCRALRYGDLAEAEGANEGAQCASGRAMTRRLGSGSSG